jgi:F0F1-type ATP synthase membrane subunit b/b'
MGENQQITIGVLREELDRQSGSLRVEFKKQGEEIKHDLKREIKNNGEDVKREIRKEFRIELRKGLKEQEERIGRHLDAVYGDFENKQAIMAESIVTLNEKVSNIGTSINNIEDKIDSLGGRVFFLEHKFKPAH